MGEITRLTGDVGSCSSVEEPLAGAVLLLVRDVVEGSMEGGVVVPGGGVGGARRAGVVDLMVLARTWP